MTPLEQTTAEYIRNLPRKRIAAGVLFFDDAGRVLLVEPTYKAHWEIPGGAVEADESPYAGAAREVKEELGLSRRPGELLCVDWTAPREGKTEVLAFVFDGGVLSLDDIAQITLPADELRDWAFCTPPEAAARLSPLLAQRVSAAMLARSAGRAVYLELGHPVHALGAA